MRQSSGDSAVYSGDLVAYSGKISGWSSTRGGVCAARDIFLSVNLHWWRGSRLRHWGKWKSVAETAACCDCPPMPPPECGLPGRSAAAADCALGRRKQRARSSEARAKVGAPRRPVVGQAICRRLGVRVAGRPGVMWGTWCRVCTSGWYGGAGACEERAVEAPPGVGRR